METFDNVFQCGAQALYENGQRINDRIENEMAGHWRRNSSITIIRLSWS